MRLVPRQQGARVATKLGAMFCCLDVRARDGMVSDGWMGRALSEN